MDNSKEFQFMLDKAIQSEPLAFQGFDRTKNVQDQLQAMVKDSETDDFALVELFFNFVWGEDNQPSKIDSPFHSMEQFWLAFVMENNFGKVWQNGEWKPKTPPRLAVRTGEAVGD